MTNLIMREQLHQQIDNLPDDMIEQIVDFTLFIMTRREIAPRYSDWEASQWQEFTLGQFFRESDEVEYSLEDAQEVYTS